MIIINNVSAYIILIIRVVYNINEQSTALKAYK